MWWGIGLIMSLPPDSQPALDKYIAGEVENIRRNWRQYPGTSLYVLVDPILHDPFADDISVERHVVPIRYRDLEQSRRPYLLIPQETDRLDRLLTQTVQIAWGESRCTRRPVTRSVSAWFFDTRPIRQVAQQLAIAAVIKGHAGEKRLLRFWDPRVLPEMAANESCHALLPTILGPWMLLSHDGRVREVLWSAPSQELPRKRLSPTSVNQIRQLNVLTQDNDIRSRIVEQAGNSLLWPGHEELLPHISASERIGLRRLSDRNKFAAQRYLASVPIECSVKLQRTLAVCRDDGACYERLVAMWNKDEWAAVIAEAHESSKVAGTSKHREING